MEIQKTLRLEGGRVNWQLVVSTLVARGMTQIEIGKACGVSNVSISKIARNKTTDPCFSLGEALLDLLMSTSDNAQAA